MHMWRDLTPAILSFLSCLASSTSDSQHLTVLIDQRWRHLYFCAALCAMTAINAYFRTP